MFAESYFKIITANIISLEFSIYKKSKTHNK